MEKYYIPENAMDAQNDEKKILLDFQLLKVSHFILIRSFEACTNFRSTFFVRSV